MPSWLFVNRVHNRGSTERLQQPVNVDGSLFANLYIEFCSSFNQDYRRQTIVVLEAAMNLSSIEITGTFITIANSSVFKTTVFHRIIAKVYSLMWEASLLLYRRFVFVIFVSVFQCN